MNTWSYEYDHKSTNDIMVLLYKQDISSNNPYEWEPTLQDGL